MKRIDRLSAILIQLQSKKMITAQEIAKKHEISIRTVYRDIRSLEQSGIPVITEEGRGYSLMEGYNVPPVMFSEEEANALITAEQIILKNKDASLIRNYVNAVLKVKSVLKYSMKEKVELLSERLIFYQNLSHHISSNFLSEIQMAITNYKLIRINYFAEYNNKTTTREVEPLALYSTHENWVMVAWCRLRKDHREFRLDRIHKLHVEDSFKPRKFDFQLYFKEQEKKSQDP